MEIKIPCILNLERPTTIITASAWATEPHLPLGFTGGGRTSPESEKYNEKQHIVYICCFPLYFSQSRFLVFACCALVASSSPVNTNCKGGLLNQAFVVVIAGLFKFNIQRILISIVKNEKFIHLREASQYFQRTGSVLHYWRIVLENEAI
jgi:hypothetical protein